MKNDKIQVVDLAKELGVAIADVQHGLVVMRLPERNSALGWISGQHATMMRNGLKGGAWRPRSRRGGQRPAVIVAPTKRPARARPVNLTCNCCALPFQAQVVEGDPIPARCGACGEHADLNAELQRLADHLTWTRRYLDRVRAKADDLAHAKDEAFDSRNTWRRATVELMLHHCPLDTDESTHCACGEPTPCTTRRLLVSVNPGIASQVERFEAMHDAQRASELSGRQWTWEDEQNYQDSRDAEASGQAS